MFLPKKDMFSPGPYYQTHYFMPVSPLIKQASGGGRGFWGSVLPDVLLISAFGLSSALAYRSYLNNVVKPQLKYLKSMHGAGVGLGLGLLGGLGLSLMSSDPQIRKDWFNNMLYGGLIGGLGGKLVTSIF